MGISVMVGTMVGVDGTGVATTGTAVGDTVVAATVVAVDGAVVGDTVTGDCRGEMKRPHATLVSATRLVSSTAIPLLTTLIAMSLTHFSLPN